MKSFTVLSVLAAIAAQAYAQLQVNTPASIVQCEPVLLSWSGGTAPYYLTVIPGGQSGASPLKSFPSTTGTSLTWNCDIAAGTSITLALRDNTGTVVYSSADTIASSSDSSCVNSNVDEGTSSATGSTTSGATSASTTAASGSTSTSSTASVASGTVTSTTSKASTTGTTTTKASTTGSTTASSSSASSSSGAAAHGASFSAAGLAGLLGAVAVALF